MSLETWPIIWSSGLDVTRNLGNYLGVLVLNQKVTEETFEPLLNKVKTRLAGWKGKMLSMAGRITLVKAILISRSRWEFARNLIESTRISYRGMKKDDLFEPKANGSLGIRPTQKMNEAILGKQRWTLITGEAGIWG
ncbi:LOW QUALITY PROTEIN: hypothetical protein V2J09_013097 [Rumex salicifolius]